MPTTEDRVNALRDHSDQFTGIDFVQIADGCAQTTLRVFFHTNPRDLDNSFETGVGTTTTKLALSQLRIFSPTGAAPDVPIVLCAGATELRWFVDADSTRVFLEVCVAEPGVFTTYALEIADLRIDLSFNRVPFSFKAGCKSDLDCEAAIVRCPVEPRVDFPVDYLARDFVSLRNALLDFAAQRFPLWTLPIEADVGMVLAEIMAALGDEFSYIQDRYNREAYLGTATERRSLRKKARLVDHELDDGRMATTVLELEVTSTTTVTTGMQAFALSEGGSPVAFEVGEGLGTSDSFDVRVPWNTGALLPYCFDDDDVCLPFGATEIFIENGVPSTPDANRPIPEAEFPAWEESGRRLVLKVDPGPSRPLRRHLVRVASIETVQDALMGKTVARIRFRPEDALPFEISQDELKIAANVVPATAGQTRTEAFRLGELTPSDAAAGVFSAVEREGPLFANGMRPAIFLFSLPGTELDGLAFKDDRNDLRDTIPEVLLEQLEPDAVTWGFRRSLIEAPADEPAFTLEDGTWQRIIAFHREGKDVVHQDYATGAGFTIRFGDDRFGLAPSRGDLFEVTYRVGFGDRANVSADTITALSLPDVARSFPLAVESVTNPLSVTNGKSPESLEDIRQLTPEAYQAETFFAVRPEDYAAQTEALDFIQRAHGTFRWTGSWHSVVVAADPFGAFELTAEQRRELEERIACVRQAGREVIVKDPKFVDVDLDIFLCVEPFAFPGQVKAQVLEVLFGRRGPRPLKGFFHPDNFTFGTPLRRSALEGTIHNVAGVRAVQRIDIRPRGVAQSTQLSGLLFEIAPDQVLRIENDPLFPERGTVNIFTQGGA